MTLHDLYDELLPYFPASVQKDLKTAVRTLAQALKYPDAKACPLADCLYPLPHIYQLVEDHLIAAEKSSHTIRNTKNNLSRLFRMAEVHRLFSLLPATPRRRFPHRSPARADPLFWKHDGLYLIRAKWPPEVEGDYTAFYKWATDPIVEGRDIKLRKRSTTMGGYQKQFERYFGYLSHVRKINPVRFDHLFDITLLKKYVLWDVNEKFKRSTSYIFDFLHHLLALTNQYHKDPILRQQIKQFKKELPPPIQTYDKNDSWIPLNELRRIGVALWPTEQQKRRIHKSTTGYTGRITGFRAGISLMFQLWTYIPYRQRNMREMQLEKNLYKTPDGQWRIRFIGEGLKVAQKSGKLNQFDLLFPPILTSLLEEYLSDWRPLINPQTPVPYVFLNSLGQGFTDKGLREATKHQVHAYTGKYWHPHIVRTVWATEWIKDGGDFMTAAIMLNDTLETVIKKYAHLREENVAEKAYEWVQSRVNHHE